jgi:hypothetical protein
MEKQLILDKDIVSQEEEDEIEDEQGFDEDDE